jgi:hypothetical protein
MKTVETAFGLPSGKTLYMDLRPELLPRVGEIVHFTGDDMQGFPYNANYTVLSVERSYDTGTGELSFVSVEMAPR